jgi:hypothetical protein
MVAMKPEPVDPKLLEQYRKSDGVLDYMMRTGMPIDRPTYIMMNWPDIPDPWTAAHEDEIPPPLQDWSRVDAEPPSE